MRRPVVLVVLAALSAGGYFFQKHFKIDGWDALRVQPRAAQSGGAAEGVFATSTPPSARSTQTVKIASFNIQTFGVSKIGKPDVMNVLVDVVRRFDLVAIQEVRSVSDDILPRFVQMLNATGRQYDFVIGPRLGRSDSKEQYAFVFDTATIEVDRGAIYTIQDPADRMHREPLVAPFRVRGPRPEEAFTFTLVNVHTDPDEAKAEVDCLADVFRAVRNDGRNEDDVIVLGDFNYDMTKPSKVTQLPNVMGVIIGKMTNTLGTKAYDNLVLDRMATVEFMGRADVFDMVREYNLTTAQAKTVSDHMPVWAEFSVYEGGMPGRMAGKEPVVTPR
jgi:deoxyribonuclease-1-like protein